MRRGLTHLLTLTVVVLLLAPATARADGYFSPWVAANTNSTFDSGRAGFGFNAGAMGAGIIGGEVDLGYAPSFFGTTAKFGNNSFVDVMGNIILGVPIGGTYGASFRPFVTGGVGLMRTQMDGGSLVNVSSSHNDWGWNAGVGAMGFFNDHVGVRGDVRYLRNIVNNSTTSTIDLAEGGFHFWRASIGVVLR